MPIIISRYKEFGVEHMNFNAFWITAPLFEHLKPTDVMHNGNKSNVNAENAVENYHVHFIKSFNALTDKKYTMRISADDYYKIIYKRRVCVSRPRARLSRKV